MESLKLIEALSNAYGACGFEDEVVAIAEKYAHDEDLGAVRHDCNLNVYIDAHKNTGKKDANNAEPSGKKKRQRPSQQENGVIRPVVKDHQQNGKPPSLV